MHWFLRVVSPGLQKLLKSGLPERSGMLVVRQLTSLPARDGSIDQNQKETRDENIGIGSGQLQECGVHLRNVFLEPQIYKSGDDSKGITRFVGGRRTGSRSD